ncbi:lysine--tRNA ligase [Candidatus Beckwithbacteria bacterium]|nr:lysine--tRNA ligase [Candidatus Beckwithbacteria bacterium]
MAQPFDQLREVRLKKLQDLQQSGINPYPAQADREQTVSQALTMMDQEVIIAGRIRSIRGHGNLSFLDIEDQSGKMQAMIRKDLVSEVVFNLAKKLDIGDFISCSGKVFKTQSGELTIEVHDLQILSKALRPLPDTWYGLKDVEERYRKRYLDMILNPEVRQKIIIRTQVIQKLREFLIKEGFIEVETPILEVTASGALAKPFTTHINAYDMDLYLRICMGELWQKKLIIAGFEKTFEIGRAFRNEGVDREHNPEFTMLEYYWGYADYQKNMDMQEQLIGYVVKEVTGDYKIQTEHGEIDFTPPYPRKRFRDLILEYTQVDIDAYQNLEDLQKVLAEHGLEVDKAWGRGHLVDEFYKAQVRPKLIQPVFLTHHPKDLKPLAKEDPEYLGYTQSFQLLASGFEISNNYSELNDPIDQAQRFAKQSELEAGGDDETMSADDEFVEALEYGMPPTSGTGIGIDRFVALLTNSHHIREVIAFPLMKPQQENSKALANSKEI